MSLKTLLFWVNIALIFAIAISGIYLGLMIFKAPEQKIPTGVTYNVYSISPYQVKVEFGNFTGNVTFPDAFIEVTSPYSTDVCRADVRNGTLEYPQTGNKSLTNIHLSSTGLLAKGISFTIMNTDRTLTTGVWSFKLIHRSTGIQMSGGSVVVPNTEVTPTGTFNEMRTISSSEIQLGIGGTAPATGYTYCYVRAGGPGMSVTSLYINDTASMSMVLEDGTVLRLVDANKDGLINSGDYVDLAVDGRGLLKGQWFVEIDYRFTGGAIATAQFTLN